MCIRDRSGTATMNTTRKWWTCLLGGFEKKSMMDWLNRGSRLCVTLDTRFGNPRRSEAPRFAGNFKSPMPKSQAKYQFPKGYETGPLRIEALGFSWELVIGI